MNLLGSAIAVLVLGLVMELGPLFFYYTAHGVFDSVIATAYSICTDLMTQTNQAHARLVGAYGKVRERTGGGVMNRKDRENSGGLIVG